MPAVFFRLNACFASLLTPVALPFAAPASKFRSSVMTLLLIGALVSLGGCSDNADDDVDAADARDIDRPTFDWTPPAGNDFAAAMQGWDAAQLSKSGEHPGWAFAADILRPLAKAKDPAALYHLGILHYVGSGGR